MTSTLPESLDYVEKPKPPQAAISELNSERQTFIPQIGFGIMLVL